MRRRVLVLGSTGSVGRQSLEVLETLTDTHEVVGLAARRNAALLAEQARTFGVRAVALVEGPAAFSGPGAAEALVQATGPDLVVCAISGAAGLPSTLAAARQGATLALANKESLVLAGHLVKAALARSGGRMLPVDSEHSALFQCLGDAAPASVRRLVLTASGGPFRGRSAAELEHATPEQALRHPNWRMGDRITVDSATLMNKALEIVEACHLFDVAPERIRVVVHPQSIVHSMVEFVDGSILAQLGAPDMRVPIRYALGYPERLAGGAPADVCALSGLTFEEPDRATFPCLSLGERVARAGGLSGTILNAANEVAVDAFLGGRLGFLEIHAVVADALDRFESEPHPSLERILDCDARVRAHATLTVARLAHVPTRSR